MHDYSPPLFIEGINSLLTIIMVNMADNRKNLTNATYHVTSTRWLGEVHKQSYYREEVMLKSLREKLQMSKKDFAPLMGLQPAEVGRMEKPGQKLTRIQKTLIRAIDLMFDKSVDGQGVIMLRDHLDKCNREEDQTSTPIQIHTIDEMKDNPAVWPDRIVLSVVTVDSIIPNYIRVIVTFISNDPEEYLIGRKGGILQIRKRMDFKGTYNLPLKKWW